MKKRSLFHKGLVKIYWRKDSKIDSPAFIYGATGLAVTRRDATGRYNTVTHMRSGLKITDCFDSLKQARLFCIALVSLVPDWNTIDSEAIPAGLGASVALMRRCIELAPDNWRVEYIKAKLTGIEPIEKEQANI